MPVYVFHGPETFARGEAFNALRRQLDPDGSLATNTVTLDAAQSSPQEVMAACDTAPFLGELRLVVLHGALSKAGKPKRGRRKPEPATEDDAIPPSPWQALAEYLPRLPQSTVLVFIDDEAPAADLLNMLRPLATIQAFKVPIDRQLPSWVVARAREMGLKLDARAAGLLAELIGASEKNDKVSHIPMLVRELEKLQAYANGDVIHAADVAELVGRVKEHKGWELADATVAGNGATAARVLQELIEDGGVLQVLLSTVAGRYRRLAIAKDMIESGAGDSAVSATLGVKPGFGTQKVIDQANAHSWEALRAAYARIIQAELDVKRDDLMEDQLALEMTVQELAARSARESRTAGSR